MYKIAVCFMLSLTACACTHKSRITAIFKSSNEDCDEFRCIWELDTLKSGSIEFFKGKRMGFYLVNSKLEYSKRDSVEKIYVDGFVTDEDWQTYYSDCIGTYKLIDCKALRLYNKRRGQTKVRQK